jgi:hypothetical protein
MCRPWWGKSPTDGCEVAVGLRTYAKANALLMTMTAGELTRDDPTRRVACSIPVLLQIFRIQSFRTRVMFVGPRFDLRGGDVHEARG